MKDSCEIKLGKGAYLEVHYECWGEGSFIDYDSEELSSELDYETLERSVEENILNR